jgi:formate-dependent nitrite reductase membrane component NrfD
MKAILRKGICCIVILTIIGAFFSGLYAGFILGKESVCGDIAFYYNNDLPVKSCVEKGNKHDNTSKKSN